MSSTEKARINIFNSIGQKVYTSSLSLNKGDNLLQIPETQQWATGTYLLETRTDSGKSLNAIFIKD